VKHRNQWIHFPLRSDNLANKAFGVFTLHVSGTVRVREMLLRKEEIGFWRRNEKIEKYVLLEEEALTVSPDRFRRFIIIIINIVIVTCRPVAK
jgi:hypothetical protein